MSDLLFFVPVLDVISVAVSTIEEEGLTLHYIAADVNQGRVDR